ncbi:hypothetical protein [Ekhidna sp.]|uniref:hypothetical protein n=1 Tax=Ekhidna sp. TaxID=2608089 RepID=UPI003B596CD0
MTNESVKPPVWFWVVAAIALLWNLAGVGAYLGQAFMTDEMREAIPADQLQMIDGRPAWATAAFAIATWGGLLGSILLLARRGLAYMIFIISLAGVIIQMIYEVFMIENPVSYGPGEVVMSLLIPIFGIVLILIAKKGKSAGWLK